MKFYLARGLGISVDALEKSCRPARENDLSGILSLRREVHGGIGWDDNKYLLWRFFNNPNKVNGAIPYWIFIKEGSIIGGIGLENIEIVNGHELYPAVRCFDIMAHPEYEGRGIGAFLNMVILDQYEIAMVMNTNNKSTNLVSKLYQSMEYLQTYILIVKSRPILSKRLHLGFLTGLFSYLPDRLLRMKRRFMYHSIPKDLEFRRVKRFNSDDDWSSLAKALDGKIFTRRDAHILNWRFIDNPRNEYHGLTVHHGEKLVGYIVYCLKPYEKGIVREGKISDWMCIETPFISRQELMKLLFQEASKALIKDGADVVRCLTSDQESRAALIENGYFHRSREFCTFFIQSSNPELKRVLSEPNRWFVNGFDNDVD